MILNSAFLESYKQRTPDWGPLGLVTFLIFYSRMKDNGYKEDWVDTCARVVQGVYDIQKWHCETNDRPFNNDKAVRDAHSMFDLIYNFKFTPPGRGLWAMGTKAMWTHGGGVLNNCGFFSTKSLTTKPFKMVMHFSMLGVGCGFDTLGAGSRVIQRPGNGEISHKIADSREGWVDSMDALLSSYFYGTPRPVFDYSGVRTKGAVLKTFGGVASGPEPLLRLHEYITKCCEVYIGRRVDSTFIVDIMNFIGKCTESGNIRRSAEIAIGEYGDKDFYALKFDKSLVESHRYMSNNTVKCLPGCSYGEIAELIALNGEPSVFWLTNAQRYGRMNGIMDALDMNAEGANPCVEQTLWDKELCNLVETYMARHGNLHDYMRTLKKAYLYSKTVTLMKTGFGETDEIIENNRRIGCSQSGIIRSFNKFGRARVLDWSDKCYDFLTGLDADYSCWFGVHRSIKRTSIKPSGTVPLLPGETGALNYPIAEFYYRTIRIAANNPILDALAAAGYRIEPNAYGGNETMVAYFPVHEQNFVKGEADVSMWEQMENAAAMQRYWADNQVSTTIKFDQKEAKDIPIALEMYENRLKAVSFLPKTDGFYKQAPYQAVTEDQYAKYAGSLRPIDFNQAGADALAPSGCDGETCEL